MENKEYKLQDKSFTLKKRCLKTRKDTIDLFRKVQKHLNEYTFDSKKEYETAIDSDKDFAKSNYEADLQIGLYTFFSDEVNLKELFSKTLQSDNDIIVFEENEIGIKKINYSKSSFEIDKINYEVSTDEEIDSLIQFGVEVFNDFFISSNKVQTPQI